MARRVADEVGDFPLNPDRRMQGFQGRFGFMHQLADGENAGLVQWERKALFLMSVSAMTCARAVLPARRR